jgi:hypothetical protein
MTKEENQIANVQKSLDEIADEIDTSIAEDGEEDNQYAFCMRLVHAQTSALLYLIKKGQKVEYKNKIGE